jgi:uncharacterized protein (TIGR03437 family)
MRHCWQLLIACLLVLGTEAKAASVLYAGTSYGPYKSTDGGATWKQIMVTSGDPTLQGLPDIRAMVVDPKTPATVYATADYVSPAAFLKSTDAGQTWTVLRQNAFHFTVRPGSLAIDPVQTNVIYATSVSAPTATQNADPVVRSTDSGLTWNPLKVPNPILSHSGGTPNGPLISGIATDPNASRVLYVIGPDDVIGIGNGYVFKSTDFGDTWSILADGQNFGGNIYVDPGNSQALYASNIGSLSQCPSTTNGGLCGLYKSSDGGRSWNALSLPAAAVSSFAFDTVPGVLYAGAQPALLESAVMKSTDGGSTWAQVLDGPNTNGTVVRADPSAASTVYALLWPGRANAIARSTNAGTNWATATLPNACTPSNPNPLICPWIVTIQDFVVAPSAPAAPSPPVISASGVVNGASFQPGIVANSWVTILGTNLAPKTDDWNNSIVNGKLPTVVDGVSVTMGGKPAYVYFISAGQINVLAPDVAPGPVSVTVTTAGGTSAIFTATASQYGPAFFLWPGSQPVATRQDYSYAAKAGTFSGAATTPAKPGEALILWVTGLGPTIPAAPAGVAIPSDQTYSTASVPTVAINNTAATVYGAALAPGSAGLYQIAIQVPNTLADGDWAIQASIGGTQSPAGTILSVHH